MATSSRSRGGYCKKGLHRMTRQNTYDHPQKGPECRMCKREYMREYMKARRLQERLARMAKARRSGRRG